MQRLFLLMAAMAAFAGLVLFVVSDLPAADFYEGKTLRITIGTSPGGGYDAWGRLVARHLGRHIPGNPSIIPENIAGAGGLVQVNNLFAATKPDGLTMGYILGSLLLTQALGQPGYHFDPQKFICIGAVNKENIVLVLSKKSGVTSAEKWRASAVPVKFGSLARGSSVDNFIRVMKEVLGFPMQIVAGYKGTTETRLAIESGEVAGGAPSWDSAKTSWKSLIDRGEAFVFALGASRRLKEIPNVPTSSEYARTEEEKRVLEVLINSQNEYSRPFVLPPGTPNDRVQILRKAFENMIKDPQFLAEVEKMNVSLDPASAEELTSAVVTLAKIDASLMARLKKILFE
jgi:tripartite-type tricarboxylate transporter receptor subunit TctC